QGGARTHAGARGFHDTIRGLSLNCSMVFVFRVRVIRHEAKVIQVGCDSFQHVEDPWPVEATNSVSTSSSGRRFTTTFSARSSRRSQSVQRRNTSTSLAKPDRISVSDFCSSAFFFPPEPRLDCRSWLSQTGISLPSGALRSWWTRLELSPVAPAILRIDR